MRAAENARKYREKNPDYARRYREKARSLMEASKLLDEGNGTAFVLRAIELAYKDQIKLEMSRANGELLCDAIAKMKRTK